MTMAPSWYSSEPDSTAEAGLPMSGRSGGFGREMGSSAAATVVNVVRAARAQSSKERIIRLRPHSRGQSFLESKYLHDVRGEIRKPGPLAAHQGDVTGVRPAAEPIYSISQARCHFREIGRVDLRDIAQACDLGAGPRTGHQRLHLLGCEVLSLVQDDESVEEGPPAHEVQRPDLDPVAQQVVRGGPAPVAAFLAAGEYFQVVHERTHPGLHLLLFGTRQEADVLTEWDGDAR